MDNEGVNAHIIATLPPAVAGGAEVPLFPVLDWAPAALRAVIVLCSVRSNSNFLFFFSRFPLGLLRADVRKFHRPGRPALPKS